MDSGRKRGRRRLTGRIDLRAPRRDHVRRPSASPRTRGARLDRSLPRFADPFGPDRLRGTLDDDYSLGSGSFCIDAGDAQVLPPEAFDLHGDGDTSEPWPLDLLGNPRVVDDPSVPDTGAGPPPHIDLGAYERLSP